MNNSMIKNNNENLEDIESKFDDEINLSVIFQFVLRNKFLIGILTVLSIILATIYQSTLKKIYKGEFQIVLNQKADSSININPSLGSLVGLSSNNANNLKTEVGILKSPSVLMPIFEYVETKKKQTNPNFDSVFNGWQKNNLKISLEPGTSILNIAYKDDDKELIIPVLKRITSAYLEYSGRNKRKNQTLTNNFLEDQIQIYRKKSAKSLKLAQGFAINQNLIYFNKPNNDLSENAGFNNLLLPNIEIESVRAEAANEIRKIDLQILNIEELGNDLQKLQFVGANIPEIVKEGLQTTLAKIEEELVEKRSKYTEEDPSINRLIEKRDLLIELLKKRSIGFLKAKKIETEALMKSAMRPKEVLLKYKELVREAQRDEETLVNLENQLRLNQLDAAKFDTPWELITKPTLQKRAVNANKSKIQLFGLFVGFILGAGTSYYREKKSDLIYDEKILENLLSLKILEKIKIKDYSSSLNEELPLLESIVDSNPGKELFLIVVGDMKKYLNEIKVLTYKKFDESKIKFILEDEIGSLKNNNHILILLASTGLITFENVNLLKKRLLIAKKSLFGVILLEKKFKKN